MGSTPVVEVQLSLAVQWGMAEKEAKDFFREEWVDEHGIIMLLEDLEEVEEHMETKGVPEVEEVTLGEVVGKMNLTLVGEGEDLTILERISKVNAVTMQLDMVK